MCDFNGCRSTATHGEQVRGLGDDSMVCDSHCSCELSRVGA